MFLLAAADWQDFAFGSIATKRSWPGQVGVMEGENKANGHL